MKRRILALLLAVLTLTALTAAAFAADTPTETLGAFNLKADPGYTLTVVGGGTGTGGFYAGANRFTLTCDGLAGNYSLVLLLKEGETDGTKGIPTPTERNLQYIDQQNINAAKEATFDLFPKSLERGVYNVYVSTNSKDLKKVASLEYGTEPEYTLGDIDGDGNIDITDALIALRVSAQITTLDTKETKAADVNTDGSVDIKDALLLLRYSAKIITSFNDN